MTPAKSRKKLIEVALPLDAINTAAAREKSIRHGHPSTLHLWWARRPLAAARAVIFAQMVDELLADPAKKRAAEHERKRRLAEHGAQHDAAQAREISQPTLEAVIAEIERERLFGILEDLVRWENTTNEAVLAPARAEIRQSWRRACADNANHPRAETRFNPDRPPAFHDPFAGGGALPLEAQRLGLEAHASDLNPVAVLINKAMIEIPPKFAARPPVNPQSRADAELLAREWPGARGLAEDVRYYGRWMREQAEQRIGHLYPKIRVSAEMLAQRPDLKPYRGRELTVIAWLWARTVNSSNPAFADVAVPLASTFMLSTKSGKEAYVEPVIENGVYRFSVKVGQPKDPAAAKAGTSAGKRSAFRCLMSDTPVPYNYIRDEGKAGRMGARLMAIVAEGDRGRVYLAPTAEHEAAAREAKPEWKPDTPLHGKCRVNVSNYGLDTYGDLFTPRQLTALTTFSDLVGEAMARIRDDARAAGFGLSSAEGLGPSLAEGLPDDDTPLRDGGSGAGAYAEAVGVYLGLAVSRASDAWASQVSWRNGVEATRGTFARQALPMIWDFAEANPYSSSCGNWDGACLEWVCKALEALPRLGSGLGAQSDAATQSISINKLVSTDPPYYDNIGYADLSDFFYVWLRRSLKTVFPDLFATLAVPKAEELVATPYRHGNKEKAESFFLNGMTQAMQKLAEQAHPCFPTSIYYAFKQSESSGDAGTASTGWETFLDAVIKAGFGISGTWPIRTERGARSVSIATNALASSIVLVCRPRPADAAGATRREFLAALKRELPAALVYLQRGNIAPVDLAQAAIGPGMAVYTRFSRVLDAAGRALTVREALALINQVLDEALAEQEGDFDADSRWALAWFEQHGFTAGDYGVAETLSKAKNTSVQGLVEAGILSSQAGQVRLLKADELPADWNPETDPRLTVWEMVHHLIRVLETGGERAAAELVEKLGARAASVCELCYRLYTVCERKKRAAEAFAYNSLVQSWPEIARLAEEVTRHSEQSALFGEGED